MIKYEQIVNKQPFWAVYNSYLLWIALFLSLVEGQPSQTVNRIKRKEVFMALEEKERLFCLFFSQTRDARSSAAKAGYGLKARKHGLALLERNDIKKEIERLDKKRKINRDEIIAGYRQLAFGNISDAVRLAYSDDKPLLGTEKLDLFNVSEIKRSKGGGLEIKFFDRIKALEHLEQLCSLGDDECAHPFYKALENSAAKLRNDKLE